ncbi:MAG: glycoside hydrolase family 88 protein [Verrucomicrobiia bacterium]|jgi:rhamnogalacturonyl hydrolase YesR
MSKTPYRLDLWLGALALLAWLVAPHGALAGSMPSRAQIQSDMTLANTYFLNKWPTAGCSNCLPGGRPSNLWTRGTYFEGDLSFYRITQDPAIYNYAVQWGTFHDWALQDGDTGTDPNCQCAAQSYIELYQLDITQTNRLKHAISNANYWVSSPTVSRWTYVDYIHMSMPMFAKLVPITGNTNYAAKMYSYFNYTKSTIGASNGLYNTTDHLWWRDPTFLANYVASDGTTQKCYWSRGNGWVFVALARTMDVLPTNDAHYAEYRQTFQDMAVALKAVQRADGFWNVNLGYTNDYPGPETSGTAMFTYGLAWGINKGYLNINTYLPTVINGWNALATGALHHDAGTNSGFLGYVQDTGSKPADGQPVTYDKAPTFEDYGLGAFLLAGSQVYALNALPVITNQPAGCSINAGQTVTLSVAATGNPAPAYQWQKNGVNVTNGSNVFGATTPTLMLTNVQVTDAGNYTVVVTNLAGSATSTGATVNVLWTFASYQQQYFSAAELADPTISGQTADPDGDGLNNLEEYAFGLNPRQPDAASALQTMDTSSGYLTLTFIRRHDVGDLNYIVEVSDDLFTWNSGPSFTREVSVTALDAQRDLVTVQDLTSTSAAVCGFMRVRLQMQ